jgi:site-specific DNA recombinase
VVAGRFKDDVYSAFKEIVRHNFVRLVGAIEAGELDVVIVRDVDRLTRNLTDWNRFEKACVRHGVLLSPYTGGDLDLSTPEGAYYGVMETLRAKRESALKSVRVREGLERGARAGKRSGGGRPWFGYLRMYANPDEPVPRGRVILREELHPVDAPAPRDAAERVLAGETVGSIIREWTRLGIKPVIAEERSPSSLVGTLVSPRIAGLREWQKYPTTDWPAIIDVDTHEQLVRLFSDPARRRHITGRKMHLLSGLAPCPRCGHGLKYRRFPEHRNRADSYACVRGARRPLRRGGDQGRAARGVRHWSGDGRAGVPAGAAGAARGRSGRATAGWAAGRDQPRAGGPRRRPPRPRRRADRPADWLNTRQRTEDQISAARRDYDCLAGSATVLGDIPATDGVREACKSWSSDRRRAATKAVLHKIIVKPLPPGTPNNPGGNMRDSAARREREMAILRQRVDFDWRVEDPRPGATGCDCLANCLCLSRAVCT